MDRATEIELVSELLSLAARQSAFNSGDGSANPVAHYVSPERFEHERERIFRAMPQPIVHSSELPEPGSFLRRDFAGLPVFFVRDDTGTVRAFLNVCRHRGTRLVDDAAGCRKRFSCPYHAWTWNSRGELIGVPHEQQGFPALDRDAFALNALGCEERHGFVWAWARGDALPDIDASLEGLGADFDWFGADELAVAHSDVLTCAANWKILVEGGIEAYHFRVAHRQTIAPYFFDNLSSYRSFGPHLRSILARRSMAGLAEQPTEGWRLREHAQVLYSIFPVSQLLVQSDHTAWIHMEPLTASSSRVRIATLAPRDRLETAADQEHWAKNHAITMRTLMEDFHIGESIQSGLASGANDQLTFGRFESALTRFNASVEQRL